MDSSLEARLRIVLEALRASQDEIQSVIKELEEETPRGHDNPPRP